VHAFLVGDKGHPRDEEIYEKLGVLIGEMQSVGYIPDCDVLLDEEVEEPAQLEELRTCAYNSLTC
jgi:hypothetical protein